MKKGWKKVLFFAGIIISIWVMASITGVFQSYKTPAGSMEPTIKSNSRLFASNLKSVKRNSIIVYKRKITEKEMYGEPGRTLTFVSRVIAFGGETLEIKNGIAYVNGILVDDTTKLKFNYYVPGRYQNEIANILQINLNDPKNVYFQPQNRSDSFLVSLSHKELEELQKITEVTKYISDIPLSETAFFDTDELKNWTADNYGPVAIPPDTYFVLGDNRQESADSRFFGAIPKKNWVGTVLWKQ